MSHTNFRRKVKIRKPVANKPHKVILPQNIYDRNKQKIDDNFKDWLHEQEEEDADKVTDK